MDWVLYRDSSSPKLRKLGDDAEDWLFRHHEGDEEDTGSFYSVCQSINMSMESVRERIEAITEEEARRLRGLDFDDEE